MNDFFTELDSDLGIKKTPDVRIEPKETVPSLPKAPHEVAKAPSSLPRERQLPKKTVVYPKQSDTPSNHVMDMRSQMMKSGVVVVVFKADEKTKTLLGHLKLETRGFVFLEEVREMHKVIIKKARASYEDTVKDVPDIEEKDLIKIIRRDLEIFLLAKIERNPVIIPMILYI